MRVFEMLFSRSNEKELNESFERGKSVGLSDGINIGMQKHFYATSELTEEENELLIRFLVRHNFVMCYSPSENGFRIRKNNVLNPIKESVVTVVDKSYTEGKVINTFTESLVKNELHNLKMQQFEREKQNKFKP